MEIYKYNNVLLSNQLDFQSHVQNDQNYVKLLLCHCLVQDEMQKLLRKRQQTFFLLSGSKHLFVGAVVSTSIYAVNEISPLNFKFYSKVSFLFLLVQILLKKVIFMSLIWWHWFSKVSMPRSSLLVFLQ